MSDLKKDNYGRLIAQKTEKLVAGLYLVTELIDQSDPMKCALRTSAIGLLSSMNTLAQDEVKDIRKEYVQSLKIVSEILSLFHIAKLSGVVSEMNGSLLTQGFTSLYTILDKKQIKLSETFLEEGVGEDFKEVEILGKQPILSSFSFTSKKENPTDYVKKETIAEKEATQKLNRGDSVDDSSQVMTKKDLPAFTKLVAPEKKVVNGVFKARKLSRRDQILTLFVKGVDMNIKDVSSKIKGCSEKTIQRELNALVFDHIVERIGEKRWSRYVVR